ncbi:MAG: 4Fe-4S binding protein [Deltaproteobacteria bacterium]|jgi:electron transport complex protein RnfB|nr:4Fe-4S binding protein [Deltaproteobacteria bacterium]
MAYKIIDKCVGCGMCRKICPVACITGRPRKLHEVDPNRCIDCGACGRICPHGAVLDHLGRLSERIRRRALQWEKPLFDYERCMSCSACIDACPATCLAVTYSEDTQDRKAYPYLADRTACIACQFCARECPVDAVAMKAEVDMTEAQKKSLDGPFASSV